MSCVVICDKCGMGCGDTAKFMRIRAHRLTGTESFITDAENHMDVCKDCYKKIFKEVIK